VAADDVGIGLRWLQSGPVAAGHGVRAVLAAPLRVDGRTVGALTVIMATPRRWSEAETQAISGHASILGQLLATAADADGQRHRASQLQQALDTRVVIEQAKGVLMERNGLFPSQAFELLRRLARSSQRRIVDVAADIVTTSRP
jgi:GAF domain-containing protein